jgi:benzylsuccinate CoA-transferase BbsF subunit
MRILDFCWIGAGALVTKALAELGAEVIRVESRSRPDNLRFTPPFPPGKDGLEASGYFASRNPDKKSFALNMRTPRGRQIALELAAECTVVTSNFRPGVMERWGLTYEDVRRVNPEVVYLVMPMQGSDGPHKSFIGFGSTIAALSGLVALSGEPGRLPVGTGTHYPDHVPNPGHALVGLLAAEFHRARTGRGQRVELSQLESTINVIGPAFLAASLGVDVGADGNRAPGLVPRGVYKTADDRWVAVACAGDDHWASLVRAFVPDGHVPHPTVAEREAEVAAVDAAVARWVAELDRDDVLKRLDEAGVPSGAVNDSADVLSDQRLDSRGFWHEIEHPVIGHMPMFRLPFVLEPGGRGPMTRPPLLGEHTWEIASEVLGFDRDTYERLVDEEVLY